MGELRIEKRFRVGPQDGMEAICEFPKQDDPTLLVCQANQVVDGVQYRLAGMKMRVEPNSNTARIQEVASSGKNPEDLYNKLDLIETMVTRYLRNSV